MPQLLQIRNKGLYTNPNEFSSVPDGALIRANNCVITADNIIEPRRGFDRAANLPNNSDRVIRLTSFQDQVMAAYTGVTIGYKNTSTFTSLSGAYSNPNDNLARLQFLGASGNLYFTTATGVYRLDAYNGTPVLSGIPKGLDLQLSLTGSSGFLAQNNQSAYRMLWGFKDANNNIHYGAPSGRANIINPTSTGASRNVSITFTIPATITTSHFYQIYRSEASGGEAVEADDELQLVYENNPSSGEITAGVVTFTDATTDDLRGATLYTSPSLEGIAQANDRPPQAQYIEEFADCVVYANCVSKHRKILTILAVGGSSGIAVDDVLTIAGTAYTCKGTETIASGHFLQVTSGTAAQNIHDTAQSLIRVINRYATNTSVYAYYLSGPNDLPGQILLEERGIGGASWAITASAHGTAYSPALPTSGTTISSSNDDLQNQLMISKSFKPEAVPLLNTRNAGSSNTAIRGIKKLGSSLFIFKEREGIYRLTGTDPSNFSVELFDSSAKLLAPDSIAVVNNQIWCLCDQGITVISETGVSVVSRPIEDLILDQFGTALTAVRYYSHGIGYETERQYILFTVSNSADVYATQAFVFNTFTQSYTRWPLSKTTGFIDPVTDTLFFGDGTTHYVEQERKSRTYADYIDYGTSYTITSTSGTTVYLSSTAEITVGDLLYQSASVNSMITAVEPAYVTVRDSLTWSVGAATIYRGITCELEYSPATAANPGVVHHFPEISMLFKAARFNTATLSFATDVSGYYDDVSITGSRSGLWGLFPWGEAAWGGTSSVLPIRTLVPLEKQRGTFLRVRFTHRQGYGYFKLLGFSLPIRQMISYQVAK